MPKFSLATEWEELPDRPAEDTGWCAARHEDYLRWLRRIPRQMGRPADRLWKAGRQHRDFPPR